MPNTAILVGNTAYRLLPSLQCCRDDVLAITTLLEATGKYKEITTIENADADALKSQLRAAIDKIPSAEELFFYFTGHGHQHETEFFYCATNFDAKRPNETGLATTDLHTLLRLADARFVVKVIDACNSGTLLIKSDGGFILQEKSGFKNLIQISSCLDSQNSLTGNPLSVFTEKFRNAALRKTEGPVFYTDIISTLRDEFINDSLQTPFFVSQHTGRELFVDDAKRLDGLRSSLEQTRAATMQAQTLQQTKPPTLLERLRAADAKVITPDAMSRFVSTFFASLLDSISTSEFAEFFDFEIAEHIGFEDQTAKYFIISVLSKEKRADNFVTAQHSREPRSRNRGMSALLMANIWDDDAFVETWDLRLNCAMPKTQVRVTLTPKFINLQRINLVVSCAPSLDNCYIFEIATEHMLQDFGKYNRNGPNASERWWKLSWADSTAAVVAQISGKLAELVRGQLESAEKRLSKE